MTTQDLAAKYPRLYHQTSPEAISSILKHGLLCTFDLLDLFEVAEPLHSRVTQHRRDTGIPIEHPVHGTALITDNLPLTEKALLTCLDDGLTPAQWLTMLNQRVFFWPDEQALQSHLSARFNRGRQRAVLMFDTLKLASAYADQLELTAINTGSTIRKPARRGLSTFTRMTAHSYKNWQRLRGKRDDVKEVSLLGSVRDVRPYLMQH